MSLDPSAPPFWERRRGGGPITTALAVQARCAIRVRT